MLAYSARIQPLLRGHKYALFIFLKAVFGYWMRLGTFSAMGEDLRDKTEGFCLL